LYANPSGATLAPSRRAAVLDAVRTAAAFLIEDDYARDLTIDGEAPPPLAADDPDGHVIHIRSLTKSAAPGLRIAALGARGPAGARLRSARLVDDFFVAGPLQQATLELVTSPSWDRHRRALRTALRTRRDTLAAALSRHLPDLAPAVVPRGGLHLWVRLPDGVDDIALAAAAAAELAARTDVARHDVAVVLGSGWMPAADALGTATADLQVTELPGFVPPAVEGHAGRVRSLDVGGRRVLVDRPRYRALIEEEQPDLVIGDVFSLDLALPLHLARTEPATFGGIRLYLRTRDYTPDWSRQYFLSARPEQAELHLLPKLTGLNSFTA
jgi:hypothetical protein